MLPAAALALTELDVLIVRHGETDYNAQGIIQGQLDTHLNVRGIDQAELLAQELKHRTITHAFTSDLSRAAETARLVMQYHPHVNLIETPLIRERFLGAREGKKGRDPSTKEERATAESSESLYARIRKFWEEEVVRLCYSSPNDKGAIPASSSTPQSARSDSPPLPARAKPGSSSTSTTSDITRHETEGTINGGEASSSSPSRITNTTSESDHNNPSLDPARPHPSPAGRPLVLVVSHGATISSLIHGLLLSPSYAPRIPKPKGSSSNLPSAIQLSPTQVLPSVAEAVQNGHLWNTSVTEVQFRFEVAHVEGETRSAKSGGGVPDRDSGVGSKPASKKGLFGWARTSRPKPKKAPASARPTNSSKPPQKELVLVPWIVRYSDIAHLGLEDEGLDGKDRHRKKGTGTKGESESEAPRSRPVERVNVDLQESEADDQARAHT